MINLFEYQNKAELKEQFEGLELFLDEIWKNREKSDFYVEEQENKVTDEQRDLSGGAPPVAAASRTRNYRCDICSGGSLNNNSRNSVVNTSMGVFNCQGLYWAALHGGVIPGFNQCRAISAEADSTCCNRRSNLRPNRA